MPQASLANRVYETSLTAGAGALTLAGAATPRHRTFLGSLGAAATTFYLISHRTLGEWEAGVGLVNGDGTLTRVTVLNNHLGTTATVSFSAGTKDVFQDVPASKMLALDTDSTTLTLPGAIRLNSIAYTFPATQAANRFLKTDGAGNLSWALPTELLALTDLSDVAIAAPAAGEILRYSGAAWVNSTDGSALTALNASNLASGTVASARVAGSYTGITGLGVVTAGTWNATAIADAYLATIATAGKVSNSATTATALNTLSAIVARDGAGNFAAGTITAALAGNASTATVLQTARNINGVSFNGSADITVTAAAGTLTGAALAANVLASSLTSVGTLTSLTVSGVLTLSAASASLRLTDSAPATPTLVGASRTTTGLWWNASGGDIMGITAAATEVARFSAAGTQFSGTVGINAAPATNVGLTVESSLTTSTSQYQVYARGTFGSTATNIGASYYALPRTAAAVFTMTSSVGFYADTPSIGAGSAVTTAYGVYVVNQGGVGRTHAYGVYIAAVSGAATTNVGLYNAGTSTFASAVTMQDTLAMNGSGSRFGLGTPAIANVAILVQGVNLSGSTAQVGIQSDPSFGTGATTASYAFMGRLNAAAGAYTTTNAYTYYAAAPTIGASAAVTSIVGVYVANHGHAQAANAYGIFIAAQTGSPSNVGLYSASSVRLDSALAFGAAPLVSKGLHMASSFNVTAASGIAYGAQIGPTLVAAANGDGMYSLVVNSASTPAAYTSLVRRGIVVTAFSVAGFTTPADPAGILVDVITGTGATNAFALVLAPPAGATNNYLIAHTTPATFNVKADGSLRTTALGINGAPTATSKLNITGLPTSAAGLAAGDVWSNSGVLTIA